MPPKSTCIVYGALTNKPSSGIDTLSMMVKDSKLEGFLIHSWLKEKFMWSQINIFNKCKAYMREGLFQPTIGKRIPLTQFASEAKEGEHGGSKGKTLIYPHMIEILENPEVDN